MQANYARNFYGLLGNNNQLAPDQPTNVAYYRLRNLCLAALLRDPEGPRGVAFGGPTY
jgi:hypothetical protein